MNNKLDIGEETLEHLCNSINKIMKLGWVESKRGGNTGVGYTFETLLGIRENNSKSADFKGLVELKTARAKGSSLITLFTLSPPTPKGSASILLERYGQPNADGIKSLHTTIRGLKPNTYKKMFKFYNVVDREKNRVFICTDSIDGDKLSENEISYTFEELTSASEKLNHLLLCLADKRTEGETEFFNYHSAKLYKNFNFDLFLKAIELGVVAIDIRIGTYKSGTKAGKTHDHGTAFRINRNLLGSIYSSLSDLENN